MIYAKIINGTVSEYPVSSSSLKRKNPNTSFPSGELSASTMLEFDCFPVELSSPSFDANTHRAVEADPVFASGRWVQSWNVVALTQDEIAQRNAGQWAVVREERNALLAACDWTQLSDAPVDNLGWSVYRQALRDITLQANPFALVWPVAP